MLQSPWSVTSSTSSALPSTVLHSPQHPAPSVLLTHTCTLPAPPGERVFEELAPELLPMLVSLESPSNFIPVTNNLLAELQRRGVSRDKLLTTLQRAGQDMPPATVKMLKHLSRKQVGLRCCARLPAQPSAGLPRTCVQ